MRNLISTAVKMACIVVWIFLWIEALNYISLQIGSPLAWAIMIFTNVGAPLVYIIWHWIVDGFPWVYWLIALGSYIMFKLGSLYAD
jgi:hypothetical protein